MEAISTKCSHFALLAAIATGKTFTGAHFAIKMFIEHPEKTGLIGANTYNQLSQATLAELFLQLDKYGLQYVVDRKPPWKNARLFKSYENILSVRIGDKVAHAFTRVMSDSNALRGLNISWAWLDETRDTPQETHDVVLSRMRETKGFQKTLVTTTTAGEDWCWKRFYRDGDGVNFGYARAKTIQMVEAGILSQEFYDNMRRAYSPQMAAQELDAEFVSVLSGRAYYTADTDNYDENYEPSEYELFVGMDFNYSPAPCVWVVGQIDSQGVAHVFDEISGLEMPTTELARRLAKKYGDYHLRIFGDASGNRGTTSNAGSTDYNQIAEVLSDAGVSFSIDVDQANPLVKDRVENVCRLLKDGAGDIVLKYDSNSCPYLHDDLRKVVWKNGKVSGDGDVNLTHASDALGYALYKLMPPMAGRAQLGRGISGQFATITRQFG
jgi:phage terminase large subunit-like protein